MQGVRDLQTPHVQNVLTVVRDQGLSVAQAHAGLPAQGRKAPDQLGTGHGNDFHRHGERAQRLHQLAFIGNTDKPLRQRSNDFFAGQGRPAALDHAATEINFIGPVDVDRQALDLIAVKHPDAQGLQALRRRLRAGDRARNAIAQGTQGLDELVHRRAGAHPDNFARDHIVQGGLAHQGLEFFLVHGKV